EVVANVGYVLHAWDATTGRKLSRGGTGGFFAQGALSPDGRLLALPTSTGGEDFLIQTGSGIPYRNSPIQHHLEVRNAGSGIELARMTGTPERLPLEREWMQTGSGMPYDRPTIRRHLKSLRTASHPAASTFSPDGRLFLSGGRLWELASGKEVW